MQFFRSINNRVASVLATPALNTVLVLLARALMAAIFLIAGYGKVTGFAGTQAYMASMGVPVALLPLVILLELGGGLALLVGFQTRLTALALAGFTVAAGFIFHSGADGMQQIMFMKNLAMAGGLLFVAALGAGPASLDAEGAR
ncbi:MAG TPA: DoxX family protein [Moraxellaceae bacterium]|nr:DoxX family protein [Moraxellaceae bacterium]